MTITVSAEPPADAAGGWGRARPDAGTCWRMRARCRPHAQTAAVLIMDEAAAMAQQAQTSGEDCRIGGARLCEAAGMWMHLAETEIARLAQCAPTLATLTNHFARPVHLVDDNVPRALASYAKGAHSLC